MQIPSFLALPLTIFIYIVLGLISYALFQFILLPLYRLRFYKKQGHSYYFFPLMGSMKRDFVYEKTKNDIQGYYKELPRQNPNLPLIISNIGSQPDITLFDPKLIKELYGNQHLYKKAFDLQPMKLLMGNGLFLAEGNIWKTHRRIISSKFHFDFIKDKIPLTVQVAREFLDKLAKSELSKVNILSEVQKITGEVVGRIFFSENLNQYNVNGQPLTLQLAELIAGTGIVFKSPLIFFCISVGINAENYISSYREYMNRIREFRKICLKIIQDRKKSGVKTNDLLGLLLETQATVNPEDQFSDDDIIDEFTTFFLAGMDTTAHTVIMSLYSLSKKSPQSISALEKEANTVYSTVDIPTNDILNQMDFTHCVIRETLRTYSPAPGLVPRTAQADHMLGDLKIKKGTIVRPNPIYNFFNEKYFEEPDLYRPERWLTKKEQELPGFVYLPFSAGSRNCIGQHLAMIEAKVILAEFVKRFEFKVVPEDFEVKMTFFSLYGPKEPVLMDLKLK